MLTSAHLVPAYRPRKIPFISHYNIVVFSFCTKVLSLEPENLLVARKISTTITRIREASMAIMKPSAEAVRLFG